ncbi:MAG: hypothetical protein HY078_04385 [Elusimicrobia bacterium]|nr:hypothetical protein [Elusimicrobiota bacterium]
MNMPPASARSIGILREKRVFLAALAAGALVAGTGAAYHKELLLLSSRFNPGVSAWFGAPGGIASMMTRMRNAVYGFDSRSMHRSRLTSKSPQTPPPSAFARRADRFATPQSRAVFSASDESESARLEALEPGRKRSLDSLAVPLPGREPASKTRAEIVRVRVQDAGFGEAPAIRTTRRSSGTAFRAFGSSAHSAAAAPMHDSVVATVEGSRVHLAGKSKPAPLTKIRQEEDLPPLLQDTRAEELSYVKAKRFAVKAQEYDSARRNPNKNDGDTDSKDSDSMPKVGRAQAAASGPDGAHVASARERPPSDVRSLQPDPQERDREPFAAPTRGFPRPDQPEDRRGGPTIVRPDSSDRPTPRHLDASGIPIDPMDGGRGGAALHSLVENY